MKDYVLLSLAGQPPDRLLESLTTAERDPVTKRWRKVPKPNARAADRTPDFSEVGYDLPGGRNMPIPGYRVADCNYGDLHRVLFWYQRVPPLDPTALAGVRERFRELSDVAITQCPDRLGDALRLAVGPHFEARIEQARAAAKARESRDERQSQAREQSERERRAQWKQNASALPAARVRDLHRQIDTVLKKEEAKGTRILEQPASRNSPATEAFAARMAKEVHPALMEVARSAWAEGQGISTGEPGRAAFDRWDRGSAGLAMSAVGRLQRLWPAGWWNIGMASIIEADLQRLYTAQIADKGVFDAAARTRVLRALEQRRSEPARRSEVPQALAESTRPTTTTRIVFMRPGELAAYRIGQDIGNGLQGLGQAAGKAAQVRQKVTELDQRLRATRGAFWNCWERKCPEIGSRYLDYSQALREKDWYHLSQEMIDTANHMVHGSRGGQVTEFFKALAGVREVDGGPLLSCQNPFGRLTVRAQEFVQRKLMRNPFDFSAIAAFADELQASEEQRAYQACRDAVEMAMRPRQP